MEDIPEKEVSNMSFVHVFNARIGGAIDRITSNRLNLITVVNKHGLIFTANNKSLRVMTTTFLDEQISKMRKVSSSRKMVESSPSTVVEFEGEISHVYVNSTEDYLAVCTSKNGFIFAEIFDVRVFAQASPTSFLVIKLTSSTDEYLLDFSWNPGADLSKMFIVCTSSGSASVFEVHPTEIKQLGVLKPSNQIAPCTCACWSPKGKQVAIGNNLGEVTLYLPQMTPKNVLPVCPKVKEEFGDVKVSDILWETASGFFIVYKSKTNNSEPQMTYMKTQNNQASFTVYGDVCFGGYETETSRYQFNLIRQWNLLLVSSATSSEMCMFMKDKDMWYKCDMEEKPEVFSLNDQYQTYCPRGVCFFFGSGYEWKVGSSDSLKTVVSLPLLVMSSDGCLSSVQFLTHDPEHLPLNVAPQPLSAEGALRSARPTVIGQSKTPFMDQVAPPTMKPTIEQPAFKTNLPSFSLGNMTTQQVKTTFQYELPKNVAVNINAPQVSENPIVRSFGQLNPSTDKIPLNIAPAQSAAVEELPRKNVQVRVEPPPAKVLTSQVSSDSTDGQADPFSERIIEEVKHFSKELKEVLLKFSSFKIDKNFTNKLNSLTSNSKILFMLKDELSLQVADLKRNIEEQRTEMLELFAMMERCRATHERNNDPKYLALLRQRPLDPSKKSKLAEIQAALGYMGVEILKIDAVLDSNWQDYLDEQKRQRFVQPPNLHIIYETLCSNRLIIGKIRSTLDYYKKKVNSDPKFVKTNDLNLSEMFASSCNVTSKTKGQIQIRRDKEAQLREFLLNRKVFTVHSTAPENLSCSRIVSAYQMREMEVTKNEKHQSPRISANPSVKITETPPPSIQFNVTPFARQPSLKVNQHFKEGGKVSSLNLNEKGEQSNILPTITNLSSSKPLLTSTTLASTTFPGKSFLLNSAPFIRFDASSTVNSSTPFSLTESKPNDSLVTVKTSQTSGATLNNPAGMQSHLSFGLSSFKPTSASENSLPMFAGFSFPTSSNKSRIEEKKTEDLKTVHPSSPLKMLKQMNNDLGKQSPKETKFDVLKPSVPSLSDPLRSPVGNHVKSDFEEKSDNSLQSVLPPAANDNSKALIKDVSIVIKDSVKQEPVSAFMKKEIKSVNESAQLGLSFNVSSPSGFGSFEQKKTDVFAPKHKKLPEYEPKLSESSTIQGACDDKITLPISSVVKTSILSSFGTQSISSSSTFGSGGNVTSFGSCSMTSTVGAMKPVFGSPTASTNSLFGAATASSVSVFGTPTTTNLSKPTFGNTSTLASSISEAPSSSTKPIFGAPSNSTTSISNVLGVPNTSTTSVFGAPSATPTSPVFGAPSSSTTSVFGAPSMSKSVFGAPSSSSIPVFGASSPSTIPVFGASSPSSIPVFGAPSTTSMFGAANTSTSLFGASSSNPVFGSPSSPSAPAFGSPNFSSRPTPAFGAFPLSPLGFGNCSSSTFGTSNTSVFGASSGLTFGQSSTFGQNSTPSDSSSGGALFGSFSGLGGKPSEEKASKNVFGAVFGSANQTNSLFGQPQPNTGFVSVKAETNVQGSFSGNASGVGAAGFGGFQKTQGAAFGSSASFGGTPAFGSPGNMPGAFGAAPTFGAFGASTMGIPSQGHLFGSGSGDNSGFASLANASTPSFEGLRSSGPDFGNLAQQGGFGSFGGGEQSTSFGSTSFQPKSPQFTQFRS